MLQHPPRLKAAGDRALPARDSRVIAESTFAFDSMLSTLTYTLQVFVELYDL
ncbi:MAG: hypothetical protein V3U73_13460 [bacterium]